MHFDPDRGFLQCRNEVQLPVAMTHVAREIVQNPWQLQAWEYLGLAFRSEQGEQNAVLVGEATFAVRSLEEIDMEFSR